jgi:transposase-like protein
MKQDLREICVASNRAAAEAALNVFDQKYHVKYGKAVECLTKDRESLLTFYDLPAEHCEHLRTTNPSVFATVPHRTVRTKGSLSSTTAADGLQADNRRIKNLAAPEWNKISCQKSSEVSDSQTASRSSKCQQTAPPDRLIT